MTTYTSRIELGKKYKDTRSELEGHASIVAFQEHGCVEVQLEFLNKDGKPEVVTINELRLVTPSNAELTNEVHYYESDLVLGHKYEDIQTGLTGHLAIVDFHEFMATRGIIKAVGSDHNGLKVLKYHSIDDFLLKDLETQVVPEDKSGKRSPVTHEVADRR